MAVTVNAMVAIMVAHPPGCAALSASWQQYSGRASLPRSKKWRDQMRAQVNKIDVSTLSGAERGKVLQMREWLAEDDYVEPWLPVGLAPAAAAAIGVVLLVAAWRRYGDEAGGFAGLATGGRVLGSAGATGDRTQAARTPSGDRLLRDVAAAAVARRRGVNPATRFDPAADPKTA